MSFVSKTYTVRFYDRGTEGLFKKYQEQQRRLKGMRKYSEQQALEDLVKEGLVRWRDGVR